MNEQTKQLLNDLSAKLKSSKTVLGVIQNHPKTDWWGFVPAIVCIIIGCSPFITSDMMVAAFLGVALSFGFCIYRHSLDEIDLYEIESFSDRIHRNNPELAKKFADWAMRKNYRFRFKHIPERFKKQ